MLKDLRIVSVLCLTAFMVGCGDGNKLTNPSFGKGVSDLPGESEMSVGKVVFADEMSDPGSNCIDVNSSWSEINDLFRDPDDNCGGDGGTPPGDGNGTPPPPPLVGGSPCASEKEI